MNADPPRDHVADAIAALPDVTPFAPPEIYVPGRYAKDLRDNLRYTAFTSAPTEATAYLFGCCAWSSFGITRYVRHDLVDKERDVAVRSVVALRGILATVAESEQPELHLALALVVDQLEAMGAPAIAPTEPSPAPAPEPDPEQP